MDNDTVYRALMENPKGGFARLLKQKIWPCRNCQWTVSGEINQLCAPHLKDVKTAYQPYGRRV